MSKIAMLGLLGTAVASQLAQTGTYVLDVQYAGDSFLDGFDFVTGADPSGSFTNYVDREYAYDNYITTVDDNGANILGLDAATALDPSGEMGRDTVKIVSKRAFTHGLFITDLNNMPGGSCGVEAGHYTTGTGEIEIIQGMNDQIFNAMTLFTGPSCTVTGTGQIGVSETVQCDSPEGCTTINPDALSYGIEFNNNGGGVYVTQWQTDLINMWFFTPDNIPDDVKAGTPDPTNPTWGEFPMASFAGPECVIDNLFSNNRIVFDTRFCTRGVEMAWNDGCAALTEAPSCREYVAGFTGPADIAAFPDASAFDQFYWGINSVRVYQFEADLIIQPTSSVADASSTVAAASTIAASTTVPAAASSAVATEVPTSGARPFLLGYNYGGCVNDLDTIDPIIDSMQDLDFMTLDMCSAFCSGYLYFGVVFGTDCLCGNTLNNPEVFADGECNTPCVGDATQICGGTFRLSLFALAAPVSSAIPASSATSDIPSAAVSSAIDTAAASVIPTAAVSSDMGASASALPVGVSTSAGASASVIPGGASSSVAGASVSAVPFGNSSTINPSASVSAKATVVPQGTTTSAPATHTGSTTSVVYTTLTYTVTSCAPTVAHCTLGQLTSKITSYTTVCPVTTPVYPHMPHGTPPPKHTKPASTTSVVYATLTYTITSCAPTVAHCTLGQLTTKAISYTTAYPVIDPLYPHMPHGTAPPKYTTVLTTTYVDLCPAGRCTYTTSQTQTHFSGVTSVHIPMVTTVKCGSDSACHTLTIPYTFVKPTSTPTGPKGNAYPLGPVHTKTHTVAVHPVVTGYASKNATKAAPAPTGAAPYPTSSMVFSGAEKTILSIGSVLAAGMMAVLLL